MLIHLLNRVHLKRKDQNQIQGSTLRDLRAPVGVGLTDVVPKEVPEALGGRVTALLPGTSLPILGDSA